MPKNIYLYIYQYINCVPTCICNFQIWSLSNYAYYINSIYPLVVEALVYVDVSRNAWNCLIFTQFCKNFLGEDPKPPPSFNIDWTQPNSFIKVHKNISLLLSTIPYLALLRRCALFLFFFFFYFSLFGKKVCAPHFSTPSYATVIGQLAGDNFECHTAMSHSGEIFVEMRHFGNLLYHKINIFLRHSRLPLLEKHCQPRIHLGWQFLGVIIYNVKCDIYILSPEAEPRSTMLSKKWQSTISSPKECDINFISL